jgi:hypothetical protein
MRNALLAAGLALAVCVCGPASAENQAVPDQSEPDHAAPVHIRKSAIHPSKPTWDQCFEMSITRGFNHDTEEWHQSIVDCMDGKIPR